MQQVSSDSGIQAVGEIPFGTHFCQFYRTRQDLIDILIPFFMAGLRNGELCLWVTCDPLRAVEARALMYEAMPDFGDYLLRLDPRNEGMLVVAVTGYGKEEDRHRGQAAGFHHHLVKPVDPGALQALIAEISPMADLGDRAEPAH